MKKIRINELARELEVKPGVILDMLPDLGVREKKTHSSSIDEDVALELRRRLVDEGSVHTAEERPAQTAPTSERESRPESELPGPAAAPPPEVGEAPVAVAAPPAQVVETPKAPVRASEPPPAPVPPATPETPATLAAAAEAERPAPAFKPLRPPLTSGGAIHPPLAPLGQPAGPGPVNRNISIPARPLPPSPRSGVSAPVGPRQPLPSQPVRSTGILARPARPAPGAATAPTSAASTSPQQPYPRSAQVPPTHVVAPGPAAGATPTTTPAP